MWSTIIISSVLVVCVSAIITQMIKNRKNGKNACGCGCSGCSGKSVCQDKKQP